MARVKISTGLDANLSATTATDRGGLRHITDTGKLACTKGEGTTFKADLNPQPFALDGATNPETVSAILSVPAYTDATITAGFGGADQTNNGSRSNYASQMLGTDGANFMIRYTVAQKAINKYRLDFDGTVSRYVDWRVFASNTLFVFF